MGKPTSHVDWANGSATYRTEPSGGKKGTGFVYQEYPPGDELNWLIYNVGLWSRFLDYSLADFYIVGTGTYSDYANIGAAVSASKSKIILHETLTTTSEIDWSLSNGVIIFNGFKIQGTAAIAGSILKISGSDNRIIMPYIEGTHTSGSTTNGLEITGDRNQIIMAKAEQNGAGGTLTDAVDISGDYTQIDVITRQVAGTLTNTLVDTGTDNDYRLIEA